MLVVSIEVSKFQLLSRPFVTLCKDLFEEVTFSKFALQELSDQQEDRILTEVQKKRKLRPSLGSGTVSVWKSNSNRRENTIGH